MSTIISTCVTLWLLQGFQLYLDNVNTHIQGLSDPEETVVCKTLEAITVFCEQGLFSDQRLLEVFTESIPFLCHPVSIAQLLYNYHIAGNFECKKILNFSS